MKNNTTIHKVDKKIQKSLKKIIKNQNELFQLFLVAFGFFLVIYLCIWLYNVLDFSQILIGFTLIGALLIVISHKTQEENKPGITLFFEKYIGDILYGSFIVFVALSIYSIIFTNSEILVSGFYALFLIFIFSKLLGFRLMDSIMKSKGRSIDFAQIFIIFSSIVFVAFQYILTQFDIADEKYFYTLGATSVFMCLFAFLFSNLSEHSKNAVSKEKIHSHMLGNTYRYLLIITIVSCLGVISWQQFNSTDENFVGNESVFEQQFQEKPVEIIAEPIEEFIQEIESVQIEVIEARVEQLYAFNNQLQVGDSGEDVVKLQEFMAQKEYYSGNLDGNFDEETRLGLVDTLRTECGWPDSTRGIMGPQAIECINTMVVSYEQEIIPEQDDVNGLEQDFE